MIRAEDSPSAVTVTAAISDADLGTAQNGGDADGFSDKDGDAVFLTFCETMAATRRAS